MLNQVGKSGPVSCRPHRQLEMVEADRSYQHLQSLVSLAGREAESREVLLDHLARCIVVCLQPERQHRRIPLLSLQDSA